MSNLDETKISEPVQKKSSLFRILTFVLTGLCLALIIFCFYQRRELDEAGKKVTKAQKTVKQAATIIDRYIDTAGRKHVVIDNDENVLPHDWEKGGTVIAGGLLDTVSKALNISRNQVVEVTQINSTLKAENLKARREIDSLKRVTYFYRDRYLSLAYRPGNPLDTTDKGTFDFSYNDSINVVQYQKRKWLFGAKKTFIDIFSNDKRTTINGVKRLRVEQNEPTFGLRIQAVSTYSFSRGLVQIGPGFQFDIKRFSLVGTYYYDANSNVWRPSVGARYDLIRF